MLQKPLIQTESLWLYKKTKIYPFIAGSDTPQSSDNCCEKTIVKKKVLIHWGRIKSLMQIYILKNLLRNKSCIILFTFHKYMLLYLGVSHKSQWNTLKFVVVIWGKKVQRFTSYKYCWKAPAFLQVKTTQSAAVS